MCGRCDAALKYPSQHQPNGHTVNLTFFEVAKEGGDAIQFLLLVKKEYPTWLDGKEHSYIEVGADMGDLGIALITIGLGHLLGVWSALSPDTVMPSLPDALKMQMAGAGMVSLQKDRLKEKTK